MTFTHSLFFFSCSIDFLTFQENPPEQLVDFYPLAEYCNGLISTFNELRLCAPVALSDTSSRLLEDSLLSVAKAILLFYKQEQQVRKTVEKKKKQVFGFYIN